MTTSWVALKDIKASNLIEVAKDAVTNKITEEPAFAWWIKDTLKKCNRIIRKVKSKYWAKTHKFGRELHKTVAEQALDIDKHSFENWKL